MKTTINSTNPPHRSRQKGSIIGYMLISVVLLSTIRTIFVSLAQDLQLGRRRQDMITAYYYAEGGARIAAMNLEEAYINGDGNTGDTLTTNASGSYIMHDLTLISSGSGGTVDEALLAEFQEAVEKFGDNVTMLERTITAPFVDQEVKTRIWMDDQAAPQKVRFVSTATVGEVTRTVTTIGQVFFGLGAAIISDNPGDTSNGISKSVAQKGNVALHGTGNSTSVIDGPIQANGTVHYNPNYVAVDPDEIEDNLFATENEVPDYTDEGSSDQLFDFNRFIAAADVMGTHYGTLAEFVAAANASSPANPMEGIIVVDISKSGSVGIYRPEGNPQWLNRYGPLSISSILLILFFLYSRGSQRNPTYKKGTPVRIPVSAGIFSITLLFSDLTFGGAKDPKISTADIPNGIWIQGTLLFNFSSEWASTDKLINEVSLNINWADLSGLDPADPDTFVTGYAPTIKDPSKQWANADITGAGFKNFGEKDDLPALMYNIGTLDVHGPANVCGAVYSPSFLEIENKQDGQLQYFKGMLIAGGGIYVENDKSGGISVISYDAKSVDLLATAGSKGKNVQVVHQD
jgi:hypothetical protein